MREILFRGKRIGTGEWVDGLIVKTNNCSVFIVNEADEYGCGICIQESSLDKNYEVDPSTVGQFTGLTDKNGQRIFESDIVRYMKNDVMVVVWNNESASFVGAYSAINFNYCATLINGHMYLEVIGNIHDNPELLED